MYVTTTTEIYTLSLHDALPILVWQSSGNTTGTDPDGSDTSGYGVYGQRFTNSTDRKSTRLNSSHSSTSYAVSCLKKTIGRSEVSSTGLTTTPRRRCRSSSSGQS